MQAEGATVVDPGDPQPEPASGPKRSSIRYRQLTPEEQQQKLALLEGQYRAYNMAWPTAFMALSGLVILVSAGMWMSDVLGCSFTNDPRKELECDNRPPTPLILFSIGAAGLVGNLVWLLYKAEARRPLGQRIRKLREEIKYQARAGDARLALGPGGLHFRLAF